MPDVPDTLASGRYRLVEKLGEGGTAVVYRATDTRLQVERAVKVLSPHLRGDPHVRARFEVEARTMAGLQHVNVVHVVDVGLDGEEVYLVMELVSGGSLADALARFGTSDPPRRAGPGAPTTGGGQAELPGGPHGASAFLRAPPPRRVHRLPRTGRHPHRAGP